MAFDNPLDELATMPGSAGDYERQRLERPPLPMESPQDTENRLASQDRIQRNVQMNMEREQRRIAAEQGRADARTQREAERANRIKAKDLAQANIPSFVDQTGAVQPVADATGMPVTSYNKRANVGFDSAGNPVQVKYDASGAAQLEDAFSGIPITTDRKTGDQYRIRQGLPWQWAGKDKDIEAKNREAEKDKAVSQAAQLLGRKLTIEERQFHRDNAEYNAKAKELSGQFGLTGTEKPEEARKLIDEHFNNEVDGYASKEANATAGFFGGDYTPEAKAMRSQLDQRKAKALSDFDQISQIGAALAERKRQQEAMRQAQAQMVGYGVGRQLEKAGIGIPGVDNGNPAAAIPGAEEPPEPVAPVAAPVQPAAQEPVQAPAQEDRGDFFRGVGTSLKQIPMLAKGTLALLGVTGEKVFGEGGLSTAVKEYGLKGYLDAQSQEQGESKDTDDVTVAWSKAKNGDVGALMDWIQYGLGYTIGQAGETVALGLIGGLAGTAAAPGAGTVAGAAGGVVAKTAVKSGVKLAVEKIIASTALKLATKEAEKLALKEGVTLTAEAIAKKAASEAVRKQAVRQIASTAAIAANGGMMELGSIAPDAIAKAQAEGRELSGAELAKVWATGLAAGGIEGLTDKLGFDMLLGKVKYGKAAAQAAGLAAVEGGTELAQTALERYGSGKELTGEDANKDYINAAALGALGGGVVGGAGAALHPDAAAKTQPPPAQAQAAARAAAPVAATAAPAAPVAGQQPGAVTSTVPEEGDISMSMNVGGEASAAPAAEQAAATDAAPAPAAEASDTVASTIPGLDGETSEATSTIPGLDSDTAVTESTNEQDNKAPVSGEQTVGQIVPESRDVPVVPAQPDAQQQTAAASAGTVAAAETVTQQGAEPTVKDSLTVQPTAAPATSTEAAPAAATEAVPGATVQPESVMGEVSIPKDRTELTLKEMPRLSRDLYDANSWRRSIAQALLPNGTRIEKEALQLELADAISEEMKAQSPNGKRKYDEGMTHNVAQIVAGDLLTGKRKEILKKAKKRALHDEATQWYNGEGLTERKPISVEAFDAHSGGMPLPAGMVRIGDKYALPEQSSQADSLPTQEPAPAAEQAAGAAVPAATEPVAATEPPPAAPAPVAAPTSRTPGQALETAKAAVKKLKVGNVKYTKVNNESGIQFNNGEVHIDPAKLAATLDKHDAKQLVTGGTVSADAFIEEALSEEVIHAAQDKLTQDSGTTLEDFYDGVPDSEFPADFRKKVEEARGKSEGDWRDKAEFVRMVLQGKYRGTITEALHRTVGKVVEYVRKLAGGNGASGWLKNHVAEVEKVYAGMQVEQSQEQQQKLGAATEPVAAAPAPQPAAAAEPAAAAPVAEAEAEAEDEPAGKYSIYKSGGRWLVQSGEERGRGADVFDSRKEAEEYVAVEKRRDEQRQGRSAKEAEAKQKEAEAKAKRDEETNGLTSLQKAELVKRDKYMDALVNYRGEVRTRRSVIDWKIANGATLVEDRVPDSAERSRLEKELERRKNRPWGNNSHPETIKYNEIKAQLDAGPTKVEFALLDTDGETHFDIAKTAAKYAREQIAKRDAEPAPKASDSKPKLSHNGDKSQEEAAPAATEQPKRIRLGSSPQTYTVEETLPQSEAEKQNGEQYYRVKNERTGEMQTVEAGDMKPVKARVLDAAPVEVDTEEERKKRKQVLGYDVGPEYQQASREKATKAVRENIFDGTQEPSAENDEKFWNTIYDWSSESTKMAFGQQLYNLTGTALGFGALRKELMQYAVANQSRNKSMVEAIKGEHNDFYTPTFSGSEAARNISGNAGFNNPLWDAMNGNLDSRTEAVTAAVGDVDAVKGIREALKMPTISEEDAAEVEAAIPKPEAGSGTAQQLDEALVAAIRVAMGQGATKLKITPMDGGSPKSRIEALTKLFGRRDKMNEAGGEKLAKKFMELLNPSNPQPETGTVSAMDAAMDRELGALLKQVFDVKPEKLKGMSDAQKLAMVLGEGELRQGKLEAADKAVREKLAERLEAAIERAQESEDPEAAVEAAEAKHDQLVAKWEEASDEMASNPASANILRRMVRTKLKEAGVKIANHVTANGDKETLKRNTVQGVMDKLRAQFTSDAEAGLREPTPEQAAARATEAAQREKQLEEVKKGLENAFDRIYSQAEAKAALNEAEAKVKQSAGDKATGTAQGILDKFEARDTEWQKDTAKKNEVRAIIDEALSFRNKEKLDERLKDQPVYSKERRDAQKKPRPSEASVAAKLEAAGVNPDVAAKLAAETLRQRDINEASAKFKMMEAAASGKGLDARSIMQVIADTPYQRRDEQWRLNVITAHLVEAGFSLDEANAIASQFDTQMKKTWANMEERLAKEVLESNPKWAKKKEQSPKKAQTDWERIQRAIRAGVMDPQSDWETRLAMENGWKGLSNEDYSRLAEIDEQTSKRNLNGSYRMNEHDRQKLLNEAMTILRKANMPSTVWDKIVESYVFSALSGIPTFMIQVGSPVVTLTRDFVSKVLMDPTSLSVDWKVYKNGIKQLPWETAWAFKNDTYAMHQAEHLRNQGALKDMMDAAVATIKDPNATKAQKAAATMKIIVASQNFIGRAFSSMDQGAQSAAREFKVGMYASDALREKGFTNKQINEIVDNVMAVRDLAYQQYIKDGRSELDARVGANDAVMAAWYQAMAADDRLTAKGAEEVMTAATRDAEAVVGLKSADLKENDEGLTSRLLMNQIMEHLSNVATTGKPAARLGAKMAFGFVNIPYRSLRAFANFGPIGLLRSAIHYSRVAQGKETLWKQTYGTPLQARQRLREAIVGTTLMIAAGMLARSTADDDDKDGIFVTGKGPDNTDRGVQDAWLKKWKPYSIHFKVGNHMAVIPLARSGESLMATFAMAGALDDYALKTKHTKGTKDQKKLDMSAEMIGSYLYTFLQRGAFSSFARLGDITSTKTGNPLEKAVLSTAYTLSPVLPWNSAVQSVSRLLNDPPDKTSLKGAIAANTPAVFFATQPALNALGDPLGDRTASARVLREGVPVVLAGDGNDSPAYKLILKYGQAPSTPNRSVIETGVGSKLTDEQWYKFNKVRGQRIKQLMVSQAAALNALKPMYNERRNRTVSAEEQFNERLDNFAQIGKEEGLRAISKPTRKAATVSKWSPGKRNEAIMFTGF